MSRISKQLFIGGIYILIAAVIAGGIYFTNYRASCTDNVQNGREEGVDCGTLACGQACATAIQPLVIQSTELIKTPAGDYDFVAQVYNPNVDYGSGAVSYDLVMNNVDLSSTDSWPRLSGNAFYILPGETKSVVLQSLKNVPNNPAARMEIKSVDWQAMLSVPSINFSVLSQKLTTNGIQSIFEATIDNQSNFDFDTVDVKVLVYDPMASSPTVAAMTTVNTFLSHSNRYLKISWPFVLSPDARVQVEASTNIFKNSNFLKTNGTREKFQQYY